MASRYFSAYRTHRISRKYSEKSASFSAMGVAVSPGMADRPAEVTVAVAVRRKTVSALSSREAVHVFTMLSYRRDSGKLFAIGKKDTTARITSAIQITIFDKVLLFMAASDSCRFLRDDVYFITNAGQLQISCVISTERRAPAVQTTGNKKGFPGFPSFRPK